MFRASSNNKSVEAKKTPLEAAQTFFAKYPKARKVSIIEGKIEETDGVQFFSVKYNRANWPKHWDHLSKNVALNPATYA